MQPAKFLVELRRVLPASTSARVISALRADPLVWAALQEPAFLRLVLARVGEDPIHWSPAHLALLAMGEERRPEELAVDPLPLLENGRQKGCLALLEELLRTGRAPRTLAEAGQVALALRERRRRVGSWKGLLNELAAKPGVPVEQARLLWQTPLACLFYLTPDGGEMIKALLPKAHLQPSAGWINHILYANPMSVEERLQALMEILVRLTSAWQAEWLEAMRGLGLSADASRLAKTLIEAGAGQPAVGLSPERLHHASAAHLAGLAAEYQTAAQLFEISGDSQQAAEWLNQADAVLRFNLAKVQLQGLRDENADLARMSDSLALLPGDSCLETMAAEVAATSSQTGDFLSTCGSPFAQIEQAYRKFQAGDTNNALASARSQVARLQELAVTQDELSCLGRYMNSPVLWIERLTEMGLAQEAAELGASLLFTRPADRDLLSAVSQANRAAGRIDRALNAAHEALLLDPHNPRCYQLTAELWEELNHWEEALGDRRTQVRLMAADDRSQWLELAHAALQAGEPDETLDVCRRLIEAEPENGLAHAYLGLAYAACEQPAWAEDALRRATLLAGEQPLPWVGLADVYLKQGDSEKAVETLRTGILANPQAAEIPFQIGKIYMERGLAAEALPFLRQSARLAPSSVETALALGQTLKQLGHADEALDVIARARQTYEHEPRLAFEHADLLLDAGQLDAGLALLTIALQSDQAQPYWMVSYAATLLEQFRAQAAEPGKEPDYALPARAQQALQVVLVDQPEYFIARLLMAEALLLKGNLDSAFTRFSQLLEVSDDESATWQWRVQLGMGETALKLGRLETALAAFQTAAQLQPESAEIQRKMAYAYLEANLVDEACRAAQAAVGLSPRDVETLQWFGGLMTSIHHLAEAEEAYNQAIALDVDRADLMIELARVRMSAGNRAGALDVLGAVAHMATPTVEDLRQAAYLFLDLGEGQPALTCLQRALQDSPTTSSLLQFEAACVFYRLNQPEEALKLIQQAKAQEPANVTLYLAEADLLANLNQSQPALASLEQALELQTVESATDALYRLPEQTAALVPAGWQMGDLSQVELQIRFALLLRRAGRAQQALEHLEKSLKISPHNLTLRYLAVDTAQSLLLRDTVDRLLDLGDLQSENLPERYSFCGAGDVYKQAAGLVSLKAEHDLEYGTAAEARHWIEFGLGLDPENLRLKADQVRLCQLEGDIQAAERQFEALRAAIEESPREDEPADNPLQSEVWQNPLSGSWYAQAAEAAWQWDIAARMYRRLSEQKPQRADLQLAIARSCVLQAETQLLAEDLRIDRHAPGGRALNADSYRIFGLALAEVAAVAHAEVVARWKARGEAAFVPNPDTVIALESMAQQPDDLAAFVSAARRVNFVYDLQKLVDRSANSIPVLAQLALTVLQQRRWDEFPVAQRVVELAPRNPLWHVLYALTAQAAGEPRFAFESLEIALDLWPDEPQWHAWAAELAETLGESGESVRHWEVAYDQNPNDPKVAYQLGRVYLAAKNLPRAIETLRMVADKQPEDIQSWLALAEALKEAGRLDEALEAAREAGRMCSAQCEALTLAAEIYLAMGEPAHAIEIAEQALQENPNFEPAIRVQSQALAAVGEPAKAIQLLEHALSQAPNAESLQVEYARLVRGRDGSAKSRPLMELLSKHFPTNDGLLALLALSQADCNDLSSAEQTANAALRLNPIQPDLHVLLGNLHRKSGQLDQAVHHYSQAIEQKPGDVEAYLELGKVYHQRREEELALQLLDQAMLLAPADFRAYYQAALVLRDSKNYVQAEELLRKAAELAPNDLNIRRQLGAVIALNLVHHSQETHL